MTETRRSFLQSVAGFLGLSTLPISLEGGESAGGLDWSGIELVRMEPPVTGGGSVLSTVRFLIQATGGKHPIALGPNLWGALTCELESKRRLEVGGDRPASQIEHLLVDGVRVYQHVTGVEKVAQVG